MTAGKDRPPKGVFVLYQVRDRTNKCVASGRDEPSPPYTKPPDVTVQLLANASLD